MRRHRHTTLLLLSVLAAGGPATAGIDAWTPGSQPGGLVTAAALAGDLCYAAGSQGIHRSSDGCRTWTRIDALAGIGVRDVAIDAVEPTRAYAATDQGLWRTLDGGVSWTTIEGGFGSESARVAVNPAQAGEAWFAGFGGGVARTTTGGDGVAENVTDNLGPFLRGLVVDPTNGWAWTWSGAGVQVRFAGATIWEMAGAGIQDPSGVRGIVVDRGASRLLLATANRVYTLPSNGAPSWTLIEIGLPEPHFLASLAADRDGTAFVVDLDRRVYRLASGSTVWTNADTGLPAGTPSAVWADARVAGRVLLRTAADFFVPNVGQGPLWRSANGGATWSASASGYQAVDVQGLAVDPNHPGTVLAATTNDGVQRSADGGRTWTATTGLVEGPDKVAVDPRGTGVVLTMVEGTGVARSLDGGSSWGPPEPGSPTDVEHLAFDADGTAFVGGGFAWQSVDGGASWTVLTSAGLPPGAYFKGMYPDPAGDALWAVLDDTASFVLLPAGGSTWVARGPGVPGHHMAVAFDGFSPATIYAATLGDGVWRSDDAGETWAPASSGITSPFVSEVIADRRLGGVAYALAASGIFRTRDGGATWSALAPAPSGVVTLAVDADGHTLYAGTPGQGVLALTQSAPVVLRTAPSIAGTTRIRQTLQANVGTWEGVPAPDFALVWERCDRKLRRCKAIEGATGMEYRLRRADRRRRIRLQVTASNILGADTAQSEPTAVVRPRR